LLEFELDLIESVGRLSSFKKWLKALFESLILKALFESLILKEFVAKKSSFGVKIKGAFL
jgi:hypothetical protein